MGQFDNLPMKKKQAGWEKFQLGRDGRAVIGYGLYINKQEKKP